jgi:hypothetical protein
MSPREKPPAGVDFDLRLQKLRLRFDLLPWEQQPHLYELADTIEQQHRRLHDKELQKKPLVGVGFEQRLKQLRLEIDLLPSVQQSHLYELADVIVQQHRQLHDKELQKKPLVGVGFEQRLKQLRSRINLVPSKLQSRLYKMADAVEQGHRQLHNEELQKKPAADVRFEQGLKKLR